MKIEDFKKEKIAAMKLHDNDTVSALNVVINKLMLMTIEKRAKGEEMTDADTATVLQKTEKELIEEKEGFEKAGRGENVAALERQLAVIKKYMPKLLSEEEIKEIILSLPDKSVPAVMKHFKAEYNGKCDMKIVNKVMKELV